MKKIKTFVLGEKLFTNEGIETKWTFIKENNIKGKTYRMVEVKCVCGNIKITSLNHILLGKSKSCGLNNCRKSSTLGKRNPEVSLNSLYQSYKRKAILRKKTFNITKEQFKILINKNCFYCGIYPNNIYQIKNSKTGEIRCGTPLLYNGIDRVNNFIGYTINNCVSCCKLCNTMKMASTIEDFKKQIKKIYQFLKLGEYGKSNTSQQNNC